MTGTVKITSLSPIGTTIPGSTLTPVVDMSGTPTTKKATIANIANAILSQAGNGYVYAARANLANTANLAGTVSNSSQPNITSVGTLTRLTVSGNTLLSGANVSLGNVSNLKITGGTANYILKTDGTGNLSWVAQTGGGTNTQVQFNDAGSFGGNSGFTFNKITGIFTSPFVAGNGNGLSNIQGANISGFVANANVANTALTIAGANVSGFVANANIANTAFAVAGANVSGFVPNANVANTAFAVAAANVSGLGNIATINLTGSTSNVLYGNGVFAAVAGGGNVSELVNGNNSFVLDSAGNVVFEGTPSGNAVDRGLVWDYGANANGVNSMIRQDLNGLSVRAWTENSEGTYAAPVNIVTNQDANTNTWTFDGQGNLTVPSGSINSISDAGDLRAYITLTPDLGLARLAGRNTPANANYTNTSWSTATYTGTQIDFTNAPDLVAFFTNNTFNVGVNQTISINGDEPVPFTGYTIGVSNAVTVYTSVTADPDPTTVTSIDFSSQSESYVAVDYDDGALNVNATGLTINIDNDQTSGPDINIRSGDDILLQAKDKALGSESEGGDINIYAGDGADDDGQGNTASTGGDIQITAGNGGDGNTSTGSSGGFTQIYGGTGGTAGVTSTAGSGGYVSINGGDGGYDNGNTQLGAGGGYVSINAGMSTQEGVNGSNVTITSGQGGPNALSGSVVISTPASVDGPGGDWIFDGNGILTLPDGAIIDTIGNNFEVRAIENVNFEANAVVNIYTDGSNNAYQWQFGDDGNLTLPGNTFAVNYANGSSVVLGSAAIGNVTFDNVTVQGVNGLNLSAGSDFTANLAYLQVRAGDVASHIHLDTGNNQAYDLIVGDDQNYVQVSSTGNILLSSYDSNTAQYTWTLDYNGNLILAGGNSVIQSIPNSSLDPLNPNVSTMVLTPSASYSSQALVLDPTAPGHIHLRAPGANIDEPSANIFLGGETSSFEVGYYNGAAPNVFIHSNNYTWTFDTTGDLIVPGNLVYIGASPAPSISGFNSISAEEFTNDTSNVTINANSNTWNFDSTGNLTIPSTSGGFIKTASNASIGIVAMDNGTNNPAQLLSMNVGNSNATSIVSAYSTNVAIQTNASGAINTWSFDNAGNLTLPANTFAINYANGTQVSLSGSNIANGNSNVSIATANGNVTISAVGNTTMTVTGTGANVTGTLTSTGKIGYSTGGNATQTSTGQGVTINQLTGLVTLANRTYNAGDLEAFSISCNKVSNDDFVLVQMVDSVNAPSYNVVAYPNFVLANTISVLVKTLETVGTDTPVLKFMIVKAPIS